MDSATPGGALDFGGSVGIIRRAALGYYEANVAGWQAMKRFLMDDDGALLVAWLLVVATVTLAASGHVGASWGTAGASVALFVAREVGS